MSAPVKRWVEEVSRLTKPDSVVWIEGLPAERERLMQQAVAERTFLPLNPESYPNCYLHRSNPNDVARTEQVTFICAREKSDAGPTNN
ncbi:MAG: phosphoenolpyruvate carboxykinase (GTP), partial [Candidatus Acidiferrales bacterium]